MNKNEAAVTARQLHKVEILTKKGTDLLVGYIQEDDLNFSPWRFPETSHSYENILNKTTLWKFHQW